MRNSVAIQPESGRGWRPPLPPSQGATLDGSSCSVISSLGALSSIGRSYQRWIAMFVIELTYKADLQTIDAHMAAHVRFLKKYYASGNFLVSGRKIPRDGGIILAVGKDKEQLETIVKEDPFYQHRLA